MIFVVLLDILAKYSDNKLKIASIEYLLAVLEIGRYMPVYHTGTS
jgi:hypothetical protein